jgi:hypothetical protein
MNTQAAKSQLQLTLFDTDISHDEFLEILVSLFFTIGTGAAYDGEVIAWEKVECPHDTAGTVPLHECPKCGGTGTYDEEIRADNIAWGINWVGWDEPGTGKTAITRYLRRVFSMTGHQHYLSQHPAEDLGGYAIPNRTRDAVQQVPASFIPKLNEETAALLVLDEFGSVEEHKQAAALAVLSERQAGGTHISGGVMICGLGNPPEVGTNGVPLGLATTNRMFHVPWVGPGPARWRQWLRTQGAVSSVITELRDPVALRAKVVKAWPSAMAKSIGIVDSYIERFPSHLHQTPLGTGRKPEEGEKDELRWASRRIWDMLTRALAGAFIHELSAPQIEFLVRCALPEGIATSFIAYYIGQKIPTPEEVLDSTGKFEITKALDRTAAILSMTVTFLMDPKCPKREERAARWWEVAGQCVKSKNCGADIVREYAADMAKAREDKGAGLGPDVIPAADPVVTSLFDVLWIEKQLRGNL